MHAITIISIARKTQMLIEIGRVDSNVRHMGKVE